jgi:hypothetical protein
MTRWSSAGARHALSRATPANVWTGVTTVMLAPIIELGLRIVGLKRTAQFLRVRLLFEAPGGGATTRRADFPLDTVERRRLRIAWLVLTIGPFDDSCLRRALVGAWQLRKREPAIRVGIRKTTSGINAHAWLEIDGVSLDPDAPGDFAARWEAVGAAS